MKSLEQYGLNVPRILLPKDKNLSVWSVIACDQYTQDEGYWENVRKAVGSSASTLDLILPEVYLSSPDREERIRKIKADMERYLKSGVFDEPYEGLIYIERKTGYGRVRHGLIAAVDLEDYEWKPFSKALIRATEATIPSRIPPRKEIRDGAPLESPHIMLLVNDPDGKLVENAGKKARSGAPLYDGDLMLNSGHITGWAVNDMDSVYDALAELKKAGTAADGSSFLFAVGDGNHSLATAKAVWDEYKERTGETDSPVRYALVEIVNIYDTGLTFEPIHRVLFGADTEKLISTLAKSLDGTCVFCSTAEELDKKVRGSKADFGFVYKDASSAQKYACLETKITDLAVSRLQPELDSFIEAENKNGADISMDYIHGSDEVFRLGAQDNAVALLLPPVAKDSFFATINGRGPLPRKSFSMGEASEKRFYLECRRLFG